MDYKWPETYSKHLLEKSIPSYWILVGFLYHEYFTHEAYSNLTHLHPPYPLSPECPELVLLLAVRLRLPAGLSVYLLPPARD